MAKVQDILKFGPKDRANTQLSVDEARAAMVAAGEAPGSTKIKLANDARRKTFTDAQAAGLPLAEARRLAAEAAENVVAAGVVTAPAATSPAPAQQRPTPEAARRFVQPAQTTPAPAERAERIETKKFVGVIKQEGGLWVAEITYKNGAGTERFQATTKSGLMLKLLEGKGNATLKVRDVTRAAKLGEPEFDHAYTFDGISQEQYDAMPEAAKSVLIDSVAAKATIQFKEDYPEFKPTALNSQKILNFLDSRQAVLTYGNLVKAFEALTATEELESRSEDELPTVLDDSADAGDSVAVASAQPAVSTAPVAAAVEPQVRKRGTTGIMPGFSSGGGDTELDAPEEGTEQREPSRAELMTLSLAEHRKLYKQSLKQPNRSF